MPITMKKYKCKDCGFISNQSTNHYGNTYNWDHFNCCPNCPPWKKYPEYGGRTIWECIEQPIKKRNNSNG